MSMETLLLSANVCLVLISAIAALLTRSIARSGRDSARASQAAAEAALRSAVVAQASLSIEFSLNPTYVSSADESDESALGGFHLQCEGASIYVHGARLDSVGWLTTSARFGQVESQSEIGVTMELDDLSPFAISVTPNRLPQFLYHSDTLAFLVPEDAALPKMRRLSTLGVTIFYTLDGVGPARERFVQWFATDSMSQP